MQAHALGAAPQALVELMWLESLAGLGSLASCCWVQSTCPGVEVHADSDFLRSRCRGASHLFHVGLLSTAFFEGTVSWLSSF